MSLQRGPAARLMIFVRESQQWHHRPLYTEVVHRAHKAGLAGASVFRGIEGFGRSGHVHTTRFLSLTEDLPCVVLIIDSEEKIRAFVPELHELVTEGVVLLDTVEVLNASGVDEVSS